MGWFGLGGKTSKVDKLVKRLTNAYLQSHDRLRVMEQLAEMGTDEALFGLLQRFTYRTEASIVDEDEKETTFRLLVDAGTYATPSIERFVRERDAIYWPIKALKEIAGIDAAVELLLRALDHASQRDERVNEQKTQIVSNLRDFPHPLVQERLEQLVDDGDEEVRIMAIDGLLTYGPDVALGPAARRILDRSESPRVKTVIFESLIEQGWSLRPWQKQIEEGEALMGPYQLAADGRIVRAT